MHDVQKSNVPVGVWQGCSIPLLCYLLESRHIVFVLVSSQKHAVLEFITHDGHILMTTGSPKSIEVRFQPHTGPKDKHSNMFRAWWGWIRVGLCCLADFRIVVCAFVVASC